jgi:hypothetical protein
MVQACVLPGGGREGGRSSARLRARGRRAPSPGRRGCSPPPVFWVGGWVCIGTAGEGSSWNGLHAFYARAASKPSRARAQSPGTHHVQHPDRHSPQGLLLVRAALLYVGRLRKNGGCAWGRVHAAHSKLGALVAARAARCNRPALRGPVDTRARHAVMQYQLSPSSRLLKALKRRRATQRGGATDGPSETRLLTPWRPPLPPPPCPSCWDGIHPPPAN